MIPDFLIHTKFETKLYPVNVCSGKGTARPKRFPYLPCQWESMKKFSYIGHRGWLTEHQKFKNRLTGETKYFEIGCWNVDFIEPEGGS